MIRHMSRFTFNLCYSFHGLKIIITSIFWKCLIFLCKIEDFHNILVSCDNLASFQEAEAILEDIRPLLVQTLGYGVVRNQIAFCDTAL